MLCVYPWMCKQLSFVCMPKMKEEEKKDLDGLSMDKNWIQLTNIVRKTTDDHQRPLKDHQWKQMCMGQRHLLILMSYRK